MISYDFVRSNEELNTYIRKADEALGAMGYTEHSFAHVTKCAQESGDLLKRLGYDARTVEATRIAGYMHDIGNMINRGGTCTVGSVNCISFVGKMGDGPR